MNAHQFYPRRRWLALAIMAMLAGGTTWVVAESKRDEKPSVNIKVDAAPLPRTEDTAVSFNPIVKRVTPSVVMGPSRSLNSTDAPMPGLP